MNVFKQNYELQHSNFNQVIFSQINLFFFVNLVTFAKSLWHHCCSP